MDKICFTYDLFDVVDRIWNDNDTFKRLNDDTWKALTTGGIGAEYDVSKEDVIDVIEDSVNAGETVYAIINRKRWQIVPTNYKKRYSLCAFLESSKNGWQIYTDRLIFTKKHNKWERQCPETGDTVIWTQAEVERFVRFVMQQHNKNNKTLTAYDGDDFCEVV